jgi:hypothetical protein
MSCSRTAPRKNINNDDDVRRAKDLFDDRFTTAMPAALDLPILTPQTMAAIAAQQAISAPKKRGKPFDDVVKFYAREKALDNTARTISAKQGAFDDFSASAGARPMDQYALVDAVAYKNNTSTASLLRNSKRRWIALISSCRLFFELTSSRLNIPVDAKREKSKIRRRAMTKINVRRKTKNRECGGGDDERASSQKRASDHLPCQRSSAS